MSLNGHTADGARGVAASSRATLAASVTPLRSREAPRSTRTRSRRSSSATSPPGSMACSPSGRTVKACSSRSTERQRGLAAVRRGRCRRLDVAAHCGAQTTADTVALAADAAEAGATAVAVIGPPYFPLDEAAQLAHFAAAADACAPLPFYVYEFARTSGYADRARRAAAPSGRRSQLRRPQGERCPVGGVRALPHARARRASSGRRCSSTAGSRAARSAPSPRSRRRSPSRSLAVVREPTAAGAESLGELRAGVERFPRQAAMKRILAAQGVPVRSDVRAPLRDLSAAESRELAA